MRGAGFLVLLLGLLPKDRQGGPFCCLWAEASGKLCSSKEVAPVGAEAACSCGHLGLARMAIILAWRTWGFLDCVLCRRVTRSCRPIWRLDSCPWRGLWVSHWLGEGLPGWLWNLEPCSAILGSEFSQLAEHGLSLQGWDAASTPGWHFCWRGPLEVLVLPE